MPARSGAVHVATTRRVYKGKTYVTHLLRRSIHKGKTVTHETLGNLSHLPDHLIEIIKRSLKGETFVPAAETFRITRSLPHGHVDAVLTMIRKLGVEQLIASKRTRQRDLVIAMIAERLLFPSSKLAHTRHWHDTTLAEELDLADATEDHLYDAEVEVASEQPGRGRLGVDKLPRHAVTDRHAAAETDENQGEDGQPIQGRAPDPEPYEQGRQGGSGRSSRDRRRAASRAAGPTTDGAAGGTRDRSDDQAPGRTFDRTGPDDRGDDRSGGGHRAGDGKRARHDAEDRPPQDRRRFSAHWETPRRLTPQLTCRRGR